MVVLESIMLTISIVFIVDFSGIVMEIKKGIWGILYPRVPFRYYRIKPFDCSLCLSFWVNSMYCYLHFDLIYAIFAGVLSAILSTFIHKLFNKIL